MSELPPAFGYLAAVLLGLAWGSFVGVLVDRVPRGEPIGRSRSRCDSCGRTLSARDLVPVFSWLITRGRCRTCGASVTSRWTVIELGCAASAAAAWWSAQGDAPTALLVGAFFGVLLGLTIIDLEHHRLPNAIVYPSLVFAAIWIAAKTALGGPLDLVGAVIGASAYGGVLLVVVLVSRGGMGMGDVKLAALIGLVLGASDLPSVGVAGASAILLGGVAATVALLRGAERRTALPFGPMLAAGAFVGALFGPPIATAYLGLFA